MKRMPRKRHKEERLDYFNLQLKIINDYKDKQFKYNALTNLALIEGDDVTQALIDFINKENDSELVADAIDMLYERDAWKLISNEFEPEITKTLIRVIRENKDIVTKRRALWFLSDTKETIYLEELYSAIFNCIKNEETKLYQYYVNSFIALAENHKEIKNKLLENLNSNDVIEKYWSAFILFKIEDESDKVLEVLELIMTFDEDIPAINFVRESFQESIDKWAQTAREKINETIEFLQMQPDSKIRNESIEKIQQIEETIGEILQETEKARTERDALREEVYGTRKSIEITFQKRDYLEVKGHRDTLQTQIDSLKEEILYVKKRADEKITIKDEFAGAWKLFIILSTLASLALIILKIIEAVRG